MAQSPVSATAKKPCFVICPIGDEGSDIRRRSDDLYSCVIQPIADEAGYEAQRVIDRTRPGDITNEIIEHIDKAAVIVADITGHNPNVFYELAIAHAWHKPYILLSGDHPMKVPFDIGTMNVIPIRLDSFAAADKTRSDLKAHFDAVKAETANVDSPVSRFSRLRQIAEKGDPLATQVAAMSTELESVRAQLSRVEALQQQPRFGFSTNVDSGHSSSGTTTFTVLDPSAVGSSMLKIPINDGRYRVYHPSGQVTIVQSLDAAEMKTMKDDKESK